MEVMPVTGTEGRDRDEYRERIISNILSRRTRDGGGVGIYGAEVCQLCGEIDTFSGWAAAMGVHFPFNRGPSEFVCGECRRKLIPVGVYAVGRRSDAVVRSLEARAHRYCESCATAVPRAPRFRAGRSRWVCDVCRERLTAGGADAADQLGELVRRRYLERTLRTDDELRRFDLNMDGTRFEMDEDSVHGADRLRAESTRAERAREALRRIGKVHGIDYLGEEEC